jgi:hypothetical protein
MEPERERVNYERVEGLVAAEQTSCLAKDVREGVDKLFYWAKAIDELANIVAILFEHFHVLLK